MLLPYYPIFATTHAEVEGLMEEDVVYATRPAPQPLGEYMSDEAFKQLLVDFKGTEGKFLAMTSYGAVPLPDQMLKSIPEKLVSRPIIEVG